MRISPKTALASAVLALATLGARASYASTPSDHQRTPAVHDRTPHVHTHTVKPHN